MNSDAYIGGLIGAFATYILTRGKEIAEKILNRYNRHRTALVKLEQIYCENLDIIYRNINNAKELSMAIEDAYKSGAIPLFFGKFHIILKDRAVLADLMMLDFMNDVLSLNIFYARTNSDMDVIMSMYEKIKPVLKNKENADRFINLLEKLRKFIEYLDGQTEEMLAKVQTLLKFKGPIIIRFMGLFMQKKAYSKKFKKLYPETLEEIKRERAERIKDSQKILDELYTVSNSATKI